ncbi:hypothetical protein HNP84_002146 [Thermocatellispora tengchongensis]|uniref:Uncharacterized protein n=1 Tax=Thermocatellispora tengchongensis TaxID=1073253 RepID=A0A840P4L9_9ACTN|nr:hypothetical protein [Thermocatellispora tengchongensis]MBB5132430.1 hypothetical protein [Thermocatellispora tengchongensis]
MRKARIVTSSLVTAAALLVTLVPAAPAAARPADCSIVARISPDPGSMYARAEVNCPKKEHFSVTIRIRRDDWHGNTVVATRYKGTHHQGFFSLSTSEPCSDVEPGKKYFAEAELNDTRFGPPIEIRTVKSRTVSGHC